MIPLKLNIKNFVSYGASEQVIDFSPHNLICLSGKNGHGKSALLDAITWVVWGQARKCSGAAKAEEGLLRLGQSHMMVSLDFSANNYTYRIKREYSLSKSKGQTNLEFGVLIADGSIKALTEKTIRATQQKIEVTIGIDYDCFVNSAFIRQGLSNEFSKKSPKERKDILASILKLNQYEELKNLASEKVKIYTQEKKYIENIQESLQEELKQKVDLLDQINVLKEKLNSVEIQEYSNKKSLDNIKEEQKILSKQKEEHEQLKFQYTQLQEKLEESKNIFNREVANFRNTLKENRELGSYKELESKKLEIEEKIDNLQKISQQRVELKDQYFSIKDQENQLKQKLEQEFNKNLDQLNQNINQIKLDINSIKEKINAQEILIKNITQEQGVIEKKLLESKQFIASNNLDVLDQEERQFDKRKNYYNKYTTQISYIDNELKNIAQKEVLIKDYDKPVCPLCDQSLTDNHKHNLSNNIEQEKSFLKHRLNRLNKITSNLKILLVDQNNKIKNLRILKEKVNTATFQYEQNKESLEKIKLNLLETLDQNNKNIALFNLKSQEYKSLVSQQELYKEQYIIEVQNNIEYQNLIINRLNLENTLKDLNFDQELYNKLYKIKDNLSEKQHHFKKIEKELALQEQRKLLVSQEGKKIKATKFEISEIRNKLINFINIKSQEEIIAKQEREILDNISYLAKHKENFLTQKGAIEEQKKNIDKKEAELKSQKNKLKELTEQIDDYQDIALALSKDGIQALLIEESLPEIEQEANSILARLTNNQAQLMIDSLKDLKSGKTKETLDIKISDSMGIRSYELFSGGEAFRIDFALRIAISKLLARRSGTALQTLIIDEGFGSQDEDGLNYIMESIYKIQDDFAKVIIVSHLESLKEKFPVHFAITKTPQGSMIKVIENG